MNLFPLLAKINEPDDIKKFTLTELEQLAVELRKFIIATVAKNGGHLAPSLGTVELTLALYSVFNFPTDKLIWDVGHQAYVHKILTGRRDKFQTLRQKGGITGFPNRFESDYDAFGVGHASTSISAALGMAISRDISGRTNEVIAVIGDGALTGGESFEALNQAGDLGKKIIVILNDNERSIDKNVGGMSEYLSRIRILPQYNRAKKDVGELLLSIPHIGNKALKAAHIVKDSVRTALVPGGVFENIGFHYVGPLDGHNISLLQEVFTRVKEMDGPILIHVCTKKGKGYKPAEENPGKFHGIGKFDLTTGENIKKEAIAPSYTSVFSQALVSLGNKNPNIIAITAAMPSGTGLDAFKRVYPSRYFDVGIAEEHAVTLAAGMAADGKHPVVAIYSTFAQRAYDQLIHDVCLQNLPVTLCLDRAGLVGADGPTHHGTFDLSYLRHMPNMTIFVPKDEEELRHMLATAINMDSPTAIRYPRGAGTGAELTAEFHMISIGKAEVISDDGDIALLAVGTMVEQARAAAELLKADGIDSSVINMRFVKPLDTEIISKLANKKRLLVTLEENALIGGFGSAVAEFLADNDLLKNTSLLRLGIPDKFIEQGTKDELFEICGLTPRQIKEKIEERLK